MEIKKCERKEYRELLDMLNEAFGYQGDWFQHNLPDCTPYEELASDEQIARHTIAIKDGEVIGCVGAYPRKVAVGDGFVVNAFGIGQVSCKKEERGRGVMSALMNAAIDDEVKKGAILSYLWGSESRYRHFGYEPAGEVMEIDGINILGLSKDVCMDGFSAHKPEPADIGHMASLYARFGAYALRTGERWQFLINHENYECLYTPSDGGAYLFANLNSKAIAELQGETSAARKLLIYYARKNECAELSVRRPVIRGDKVLMMLKENAARHSINPCALAGVFGNSADAEKVRGILWGGENAGAFWVSVIDEV